MLGTVKRLAGGAIPFLAGGGGALLLGKGPVGAGMVGLATQAGSEIGKRVLGNETAGAIVGGGLGFAASATPVLGMTANAVGGMMSPEPEPQVQRQMPPAIPYSQRLAIDTDYRFDQAEQQRKVAEGIYRRALEMGDYQLAEGIASGRVPVDALAMGGY